MNVLAVFGTRPETIKMAPVIHELRRRAADAAGRPLAVRVCVTAQHRQMLDQVLGVFQIVPDDDLDVMEEGQSPAQVAAAVLARLSPLLERERPDWVLVQGDTTTVAAAALAAFYAGVKVGHVEAGLRTHDKWRPFPEEINRRIAGVIADWHFAPTARARQNLLREGVPDAHILITGNPVVDALRWAVRQPLAPAAAALLRRVGWCGDGNGRGDAAAADGRALAAAPRLILVTAHRRESFGRPLESICLALRDVATRYEGRVHILYPVHLNPNVWAPVHRLLAGVPGVTLTPPLDYLALVQVMQRAALVLTDSGGIQEEAPSLGKPVLVLREVTERPEAVEAGAVRVVGTHRERIVIETVRLLEDAVAYRRMAQAVNPYGDGRASERIVAALLGEPVVPFVPATACAPGEQALG